MIDKELSEILDALTRESMPPYQELELLGYNPFGILKNQRCTEFTDSNDDDDDEYTPSQAEDDEIDYDDGNFEDDDDDNGNNVDEEYEFDEDDEEYTLLTQVLRLNNCRKKYFA